MKLRDYQHQILTEYRKARVTHNKIVIQLPTGTGKSVIANTIINEYIDKGFQVAVLVPNCTLVANMQKYLPDKSTIAYGGQIPDLSKPVLISTYQSALKYMDGLHSLGLIITDECHHSVSKTLKAIYKKYSKVHSVGFTATTRRLDKHGLDQVYTKLITSPPIGYFIDKGYLSDFEVIVPTDNLISFTNLTDFEDKILALLKEIPKTESLYKLWESHGGKTKKTIIFNIDVDHSKQVNAYFKSKGINSYHIDGTMDDAERNAVIKLFSEGIIDVICNVRCLVEGVDINEIDCVIQNNFFRSEVDFYQTIGRGLRPRPGKKLTILDMARNFYIHGNPKNNKFWDIQTKTTVKTKKSRHLIYCAYCESELGHIGDIWPHELINDDNFISYLKKNICCLSDGCLSHTMKYKNPLYGTGEFCLDTMATFYQKQKSKSPTKANFSDSNAFSSLDLANAELTSIILSKMSTKKKIDRIVDLENIDVNVKARALLSLNIPKSNVKEYLNIEVLEIV